MPQLFEASAFFNLIIVQGGAEPSVLEDQYVLDLTFYEIGNALCRLLSVQKKVSAEEASYLLQIAVNLSQSMRKIGVPDVDLSSTMDLAAT